MRPIGSRLTPARPAVLACVLLLSAGCGGRPEPGTLTPEAEQVEQDAKGSMDYMMEQQEQGAFR